MQAVILVSLLRFRAALSVADVALLLLAAAGSGWLLWWQRARPATYSRWSTALRVLQRLIVASPVTWKVTQQVLDGELPYGHGALPDAALYSLLIFFTCCGATGNGMMSSVAPRGATGWLGCVDRGLPALALPNTPSSIGLCPQALAHPLPLWMHVPTQAAMIAFVRYHTPGMCGTAALQHPTTQAGTAAVRTILTALLGLLPFPMVAPQHGPAGQCAAVLTLAELLLGFLLPTLTLSVWEARQHERYCRHWAAWQRQQEMQQQRRQEQEAVGPSSRHRPAARHTRWCPAVLLGSEAAAAGLSAARTDEPDLSRCPFLTPPSRAAAIFYRLLLACCSPAEVVDYMTVVAAAVLLLLSAWHLVLLLTPAN